MPKNSELSVCSCPENLDCYTYPHQQSSTISFSSTQSSIQISNTQEDEITVVTAIAESDQDVNAEIEVLEQRLDNMMQQRVQQALELQRLRDNFNERAPILGYVFLPSAVKALKFIGIVYWAFFVVRFICLADLNLLLCLLGSISLICLTFAFATEQHIFFWPFALVSVLESINAAVQFVTISMLIYRSNKKLAKFMNDIMEREDLFGNSLLDEMQDWDGILTVQLYTFTKMFIFSSVFFITAQVAKIFHDKDDILQAREINMDMHHGQMVVIIQRLDVLRRTQAAQRHVQPSIMENTQHQPIVQNHSSRIVHNSASMPHLGSHRFNARAQLSAIRSVTD